MASGNNKETALQGTISEEQLIRGCVTGNSQAQKVLFNKYANVMFGVCMRYTDNTEDAKDVLQEGFIIVFNKIEQFGNRGSFEGWIKRIMINTALQHHRKKVKVLENNEFERIPHYQCETLNELETNDLLDMIRRLPKGCRTVFNLYVIEGFSHKEIAEKLNISVGTSKSQLSDARSMLRKKLEQNMAAELKTYVAG